MHSHHAKFNSFDHWWIFWSWKTDYHSIGWDLSFIFSMTLQMHFQVSLKLSFHNDLWQMILSFELPFALIPLLKFSSTTTKMGPHKNSTIVSWKSFICYAYELAEIQNNNKMPCYCVDNRFLMGGRSWDNRHQHSLLEHDICQLADS